MTDAALDPSGDRPADRVPGQWRADFMREGLRRADLDSDPIAQFERWYAFACATEIPEPNAMTLATVDHNGQPWVRSVLLKLYDRQGFVFFTNYGSDKALQIERHPSVALLFPWVAFARQVQVNGRAERISTAESLKYFATRARGSKIGAWASPQSQVIRSRALLEAKVSQIKERFADGQIPLPDFWGGYRVVPECIEFWQGRDNRLHDRFRYRRAEDDTGWTLQRLAP
ncbi:MULTISPECIES: pyridoxamine 5'-phosphate oxidase [Thiorhodovibrio]|uniref:pyridoxamine 5'-phosphate oxidase n=1 Tax=Thiorhodovibrio TaxID=61593 RepID=UPI0019116D26|nr:MULTISPECIES: pyridoxamine 5'-phosphate oxidase [Thiorhodovibrio]MBK5969750.1 pyridoxamine 5'-phosphate oxidase [Thiorhodovibrio winogradskyi]WPL13801.1 Pyridoxine/pyridoxamine 5'-phosphate oxidase [Thiorhodovibrio litoralis]